MTRPPITEQLVAEAKQARNQFLAEVQALVDEHGPRILGMVMIEVAMHPVPGMASFLNYFLLRDFMDLRSAGVPSCLRSPAGARARGPCRAPGRNGNGCHAQSEYAALKSETCQLYKHTVARI